MVRASGGLPAKSVDNFWNRGALGYDSGRMETHRCAVHGLILGPDGRCVICRRGEEERKAATSADLPVVAFAAVVGVAVIGVLGYWLTRKIGELSSRPPDVVVTAAVDTPPDTPPEPPKPAVKFPDAPPQPTPTLEPLVAQGPTQEELDTAKRAVKITFYSGKSCSLCDRAREMFQTKRYQVHEVDVDASETDKVLLKSVNPAGSVPTFDVEGKILVGYDRAALDGVITKIAKKRLERSATSGR